MPAARNRGGDLRRTCPNCGRSYTRTSPWKIAAIAAGAFLLTVGGCGGCVALVAQDAEEYSISGDEYADLGQGTPQAAVESQRGEPYAEEQTAGETCLYYEDDSFFSDREYGLCFRGGILVRKFDYRGAD